MPITEVSNTPVNVRDEWRTPPELFDPLNSAFDFHYDFAASADNALAPRYFTREDSALDAALWWRDRTAAPYGWLNPPFSMLAQFLSKANEQIAIAGELYGYGCICCLVKADAPETKWWRDNVIDEYGHAKHEIRYLYPRVNYVNDEGNVVKGCNFPSALVIMRPTSWRQIAWVKWQSR